MWTSSVVDDPSCCGTKIFYLDKPDIPEPVIECRECDRKVHKGCILYIPALYPEGYLCEGCHNNKKGVDKPLNPFTAEKLHETELSTFVENYVNVYHGGALEERITIRVLYSLDNETGLFAFQKIQGHDVCCFAMYVEDDGGLAGEMEIKFIDSVKFIQPANERTSVYQHIVLGYMKYANLLGYTQCKIMSSPPENDHRENQYIFNGTPPNQRVPNQEHLDSWYRVLFKTGINVGIIREYEEVSLFFVIQLQKKRNDSMCRPINQDSEARSSFMTFMTMTNFKKILVNNGYDFTSLRRAQYATCQMLYSLHTMGMEQQQKCQHCGIICTNSIWRTLGNSDVCLSCYDSDRNDSDSDDDEI